MTISKKIIGGYIAILSLLVLVTGVAFYALKQTQATYNNFLNVDERLLEGANELRYPHFCAADICPGYFALSRTTAGESRFIWPKMTASSSRSLKECAA